MSEYNRDIKSLLQNDYDLMFQYHELLCLRAELARLLSRSNSSARARITRQNRSAARSVKRDEGASVPATHPAATEAGASSNIGRPAGETMGGCRPPAGTL